MKKSIKNGLSLILSILILIASVPVFANTSFAESEDNIYFITDPVDELFEPHTDLQLSYLHSLYKDAILFAEGTAHLSDPRPLHLSWTAVCEGSAAIPLS